jgi:glycosyltransferase involved in cell wall biosynthesis
MVPHVNLVIATPGHSMMASYVMSLIKTAQVLNEKRISWTFVNRYSSNVADAREVTLSNSMNNDVTMSKPLNGEVTYDKILWIDSDIAWEPEDVIKLYESDKDIISGAYYLSSGEVTAYPKLLGPGYNYKDVKNMKDIVEIDSAGFGFLCIKSGVFESLSRPWFQQVFVNAVINDKDYVMPIMGEDMSLCVRAKQAGFKIWFDPSVKVQHHKTVSLDWKGIDNE